MTNLNARQSTIMQILGDVGGRRCDLLSSAKDRMLKSVCIFISITLLMANHAHLSAQEVTTVAPPSESPRQGEGPGLKPLSFEPVYRGLKPAATPGTTLAQVELPDAPGTPHYPDAVPIPPKETAPPVSIEVDRNCGTQTIVGGVYTADCKVVITEGDRVLRADHIEYDRDTADVTMTGHVVITEGENDLHIEASYGIVNLDAQTGHFYDVSGSVGLKHKSSVTLATQRAVYANGNPFLFTGREVVKTGPRQLQIYGGTITSCQLPRPDWVLSGREFSVDGDKAYASNTVFRILNFPVLWLPYATHPVDTSTRQTGILIPEVGINSAAKGNTIGEQVYWAINRSTDLTVGSIYYSARGYEQSASFRYRGLGQDFAKAHYSGLQDRGYFPGGGPVRVNQSGTDVVFSGRHDLSVDSSVSQASADAAPHQTRIVADVEYLSSFPYREAFSSNFNQAVSSDVVSTVYATREWGGMAASLEGDRYQGEKRVANTTTTPPQVEQQVHIFHAPAVEFTTIDHRLGSTGIEWNVDSSLAALKRTQPNFETGGMVERLDVRPELAYPIGGGGWRVRPSVAGRETFYSRSRFANVPGVAGSPVESLATLNRGNVDVQVDVRPPVLERTFDSGWVRNLLRHDVKHTIEPEVTYRYVDGIGGYSDTLRFDMVDIASDTNELEYGVTQRLFLRRTGKQPCRTAGSYADATEILGTAGQEADAATDPGESAGRVDSAEPVCGSREWISWRVAQKYFFDSTFDGAVVQNGPRSILETTLNFSGISFLTGPRNVSPIVSRLRVRTSDKTDVEWDFDFDTCSSSSSAAVIATARPCSSKFTANNIYVEVHQGNISSGISYARLNAPARSYVDGVLSSVADFNQMRVHLGFGKPTKAGWSAAASTGLDLDLGTVQYGAIQTSYNWNCCGVSVEYRKYELGTARNDNGYKFNFTLANIGSAGNLRHSDQVF